MRNSEKHGKAGASNAATQPYRLVGGTHDNPRRYGMTALAMKSKAPSNFRETTTYEIGMIGGLMAARLGFDFLGAKELEARLA